MAGILRCRILIPGMVIETIYLFRLLTVLISVPLGNPNRPNTGQGQRSNYCNIRRSRHIDFPGSEVNLSHEVRVRGHNNFIEHAEMIISEPVSFGNKIPKTFDRYIHLIHLPYLATYNNGTTAYLSIISIPECFGSWLLTCVYLSPTPIVCNVQLTPNFS